MDHDYKKEITDKANHLKYKNDSLSMARTVKTKLTIYVNYYLLVQKSKPFLERRGVGLILISTAKCQSKNGFYTEKLAKMIKNRGKIILRFFIVSGIY